MPKKGKGRQEKGKGAQANFTEFDDEIDSCCYFSCTILTILVEKQKDKISLDANGHDEVEEEIDVNPVYDLELSDEDEGMVLISRNSQDAKIEDFYCVTLSR